MTEKQFEELYDAHVDAIARFLSYYTKEKNVLEDLLQEVFFRIWKYREGVDLTNCFVRTYLLKTARNVALSYLEKEKSDPVEIREQLPEILGEGKAEEKTKLNRLQASYEKALLKAPPKARDVYSLSREEGLTYKEIAQSLDISPKTVEVHISKVLRILKKELNEYKV